MWTDLYLVLHMHDTRSAGLHTLCCDEISIQMAFFVVKGWQGPNRLYMLKYVTNSLAISRPISRCLCIGPTLWGRALAAYGRTFLPGLAVRWASWCVVMRMRRWWMTGATWRSSSIEFNSTSSSSSRYSGAPRCWRTLLTSSSWSIKTRSREDWQVTTDCQQH